MTHVRDWPLVAWAKAHAAPRISFDGASERAFGVERGRMWHMTALFYQRERDALSQIIRRHDLDSPYKPLAGVDPAGYDVGQPIGLTSEQFSAWVLAENARLAVLIARLLRKRRSGE